MPTAKKAKAPKYCLHKPSGRAYVRIRGQFRYIGDHGTRESLEAYGRIIAEFAALRDVSAAVRTASAAGLTVVELANVYHEFCKGYYRKKDGTPSGWLDHIQLVLHKHLAELYGHTPAADFGPKAFKAIRQRLAQGEEAAGNPGRGEAQGRQSWLFATYTGVHPMLERLHSVVTRAGFKAKVLNADQVPTKNRSAWIARNAPGVDVMISHPAVVETGLTLFDPKGSFNFPTIIFGTTGYNTFTLRQASRRSWRIGQRLPCRVFFLYYSQTMQSRAMMLMAQKIEASLALEGTFSADGLAAMSADSGSLTMELAKSLVQNIDFGDAERIWAKSGRKNPPRQRLKKSSRSWKPRDPW